MKRTKLTVTFIVAVLVLVVALGAWGATTKKSKAKSKAQPKVEATEKAKSPDEVAKAAQASALEKLKKTYPKITVETFSRTGIPGVYEIIAGQNIIYFNPDTGALIFGEIMLPNGTNLTQKRREAMAALSVKKLPLDKAVKSGSGSNTVIMFTDPDCPYCKSAQKFLNAHKDKITQYTFFVPLRQIHPDAEAKCLYILEATDKAKAYAEIDAGNVKIDKTYKAGDDAKKLLALHEQSARAAGVQGTPMLFVDGKTVSGANIPMIKGILGIK